MNSAQSKLSKQIENVKFIKFTGVKTASAIQSMIHTMITWDFKSPSALLTFMQSILKNIQKSYKFYKEDDAKL